VFIKHEAKLTLVKIFATTLEVKKDLLSISTLEHDSREDTKPSTKKNKATSSKLINKDKYLFGFQGLAKSLKQLNNEVFELKRKTSDIPRGENLLKGFFESPIIHPLRHIMDKVRTSVWKN